MREAEPGCSLFARGTPGKRFLGFCYSVAGNKDYARSRLGVAKAVGSKSSSGY